jgi:hypothetical protein
LDEGKEGNEGRRRSSPIFPYPSQSPSMPVTTIS